MSRREGVSLLETLVVIAIIGMLLGLLFPALQSARTRALEIECRNNLHQINLAIAQYSEANKRLPGPGASGLIGGWTIDVLPFLEQKNLRDQISTGKPIATAPDILLRQPRNLQCPVRRFRDPPVADAMDHSHYVFVPHDKRRTYNVFDAPLELKTPWASGPEMTYNDVIRQTGPHRRGFFYAQGFQNAIGFMLDGEDVP